MPGAPKATPCTPSELAAAATTHDLFHAMCFQLRAIADAMAKAAAEGASLGIIDRIIHRVLERSKHGRYALTRFNEQML